MIQFIPGENLKKLINEEKISSEVLDVFLALKKRLKIANWDDILKQSGNNNEKANKLETELGLNSGYSIFAGLDADKLGIGDITKINYDLVKNKNKRKYQGIKNLITFLVKVDGVEKPYKRVISADKYLETKNNILCRKSCEFNMINELDLKHYSICGKEYKSPDWDGFDKWKEKLNVVVENSKIKRKLKELCDVNVIPENIEITPGQVLKKMVDGFDAVRKRILALEQRSPAVIQPITNDNVANEMIKLKSELEETNSRLDSLSNK